MRKRNRTRPSACSSGDPHSVFVNVQCIYKKGKSYVIRSDSISCLIGNPDRTFQSPYIGERSSRYWSSQWVYSKFEGGNIAFPALNVWKLECSRVRPLQSGLIANFIVTKNYDRASTFRRRNTARTSWKTSTSGFTSALLLTGLLRLASLRL